MLHACGVHRIIGCARCFHGISEGQYQRIQALPGRSRAFDAADRDLRDGDYGFSKKDERQAVDEAVRALVRRVRRRGSRSRARDCDTTPAASDLRRLQAAAAEHLKLC
jgi:hypothetical protein